MLSRLKYDLISGNTPGNGNVGTKQDILTHMMNALEWYKDAMNETEKNGAHQIFSTAGKCEQNSYHQVSSEKLTEEKWRRGSIATML